MTLTFQEEPRNITTRMNPSYIYASSLVKTREHNLLNDTQLEMLLTAKSLGELELALQDTYLAPYLSGRDARSISRALEQSVEDAQNLLKNIAPKPELLDILWIKYDFYNLRTVIKGVRNNQSEEDILSNCFNAGLYAPEILMNAYAEEKLHNIDEVLSEAVHTLPENASGIEIEEKIQKAYFETITSMAKKSGNAFLKRYVRMLTNIFNLLSYLRISARSEYDADISYMFIEGGSFTKKDLQSKEDALALLSKLGDEKKWSKAIEDYNKTGNFSLLEKTADEHILDRLDEEAFELFSLAPLYAYFTALKNNAQTIRAIVVGKETGMSEHNIRFNLRKLYK